MGNGTCSTDRDGIIRLKHAYWRACDARDVPGFRACFVRSGGEVSFGPLGTASPDEMTEIFRAITGERHPDGGPRMLDMHHGFMPTIDVEDASTARGTWTLQFRQVDRLSRTETVSTGEYDDTYVVEDGQWKIRTSHFTPGWTISRPLTDETVTWPGHQEE